MTSRKHTGLDFVHGRIRVCLGRRGKVGFMLVFRRVSVVEMEVMRFLGLLVLGSVALVALLALEAELGVGTGTLLRQLSRLGALHV